MALTLYVDGDRWRDHLRSMLHESPGLVPVAKGNGYGFTNGRLARRAAWLGVDTLAVGTYRELEQVRLRYDGDLLVLSPFRTFEPGVADAVADRRVVHTVGRAGDLTDLARLGGSGHPPRVVVELSTSMLRHGFDLGDLGALRDRLAGLRLEGLSLHLPLRVDGHDNLAEARRLVGSAYAARLLGERGTLWASHLTPADQSALASAHPGLTVRPRVGTALWLGDEAALAARAHVLDATAVTRGTPYGYRGRTAPRAGTILVVSGGTAHGIGLTAPTGAGGLRNRAASLARGGLDAAGLAQSPFTVAGRRRLFAEPPHMQVSLVFLPDGTAVPQVGTEVSVRVRHTTTTFDRVVFSPAPPEGEEAST